MDLTEEWEMSDMILSVEDKKIYINKAIVSIWSPVLRTMFTSEFKEKQAKEITLPEKCYEEVLELMLVMHNPNKALNEHYISGLLSLSREYQMEAMTNLCEQFLLKQEPSVANFVTADEYKLPQLREICLRYLTEEKSVEQIVHDELFKELEAPLREELLTERCRRLEARSSAHENFMRALVRGKIVNTYDCRYCPTLKLDKQHYLGTDVHCETCCHEMIRFVQYRVQPLSGRFCPTLDFK